MKQTSSIWLAVIALALFLVAGLAQTSFAQWSNDPSVSAPIRLPVYWMDGLVTAVSDEAGGVIAAWVECGSQGGRVVIAQRLSSDGRRLWLPNGTVLDQQGGNYYSHLLMVSDQAGGAIVLAYRSSSLSIVQRINGSGVPLWGGGRIINDPAYPAGMVSDGAGGAIVVWNSGEWNTGTRIYAQRIDAGGNFRWNPPGVLVCTDTSHKESSQIVSDGSGGVVIAWDDRRNVLNDPAIYAQRISATGGLQWLAAGVPIAVSLDLWSTPRLTPDGTGGAVIAWKDDRGGCYAQRINGAGIVQWILNGINASPSSTVYWGPRSIISDGTGGAVVVWEETNSSGSAAYAQRLSTSGTLLWPAGGVEIHPHSYSPYYGLALINDGSGGFIAFWQPPQQDYHIDLYAQRFSLTGARQWRSTGVPVSTNPLSDWLGNFPAPVLDGRGGVIIPWLLVNYWAYGPGVSALYAQRLNLDGTLGASNVIANGQFEQGTTNWTMYSAAPNGINFSTVAGGPSGSYAKVHINATSNNMQVYQTYFPLTAGKRYTLGFDAYSPASRRVFVTVHKHGAPYGSYGFGEWIQLGPSWTHYERQFTAAGFSGTTSDTRLRFYFVYACGAGDDYYFDNVSLAQVLAKSGEEQIAEQPTTFLLEQNFPNPFNPTTMIRFQIPNDGHVSLKVFDMLGREVATLVDEVRDAGVYEAVFDATTLSSGMYFYRLQSGSYIQTLKMIVVK